MTLPDGWDWHKKIPNWDRTGAALHGWPAWEKAHDGQPFSVFFEIVHEEHMSSRDMAVAWDDVIVNRWPANGAFDYRDWTSSSTPFVSGAEKYWSCFCFQYEVDARAFQEMFGGIGTWQIGYREIYGKMFCERNGIGAFPIKDRKLEDYAES